MNNVKLPHIKSAVFQFFNSSAALEINKKFAPREKLNDTLALRNIVSNIISKGSGSGGCLVMFTPFIDRLIIC